MSNSQRQTELDDILFVVQDFILQANNGLERKDLVLDLELAYALNNKLDYMSLVLELEESYNIDFSDEAMSDLKTIQDVVNYICKEI